MKKRILLSSAAISVLGGFFFYFVSGDVDVHAQMAQSAESKVVRSNSVKKVEDRNAIYAAAASENAKLRNSLKWVFGGKTQTGWNIYVSLISHTIGTESGPDTTDFALALSKWQQKSGLTPSGVLDQNTLEKFTKFWQSQRLGRAGLQPTTTLLSAPIGEFWDPSRSPDLLQVEQETFAAYKRMIAAASKELGASVVRGNYLKIISSYRSPEYQETLRKKEPNAGRAALAKNSPHSTGHALDIYVGGEPVKTEYSNRLLQVQTPAYKWLVRNAAKYGFYPYFYEPWHWEYVPNK